MIATMSKDRRTEIRNSRKTTILGTLAGWMIRVVCATLRYRIVDRAGIGPGSGVPPLIFVLWHNRVFVMPSAWKRLTKGQRPAAVLTSASHDGAMLARAVGVFGIEAVRGSSSRRAVAALIGLKRTLQQGLDVCVTPDGPRGPCYQLQPGLVKLAENTGAAVVPIHVKFGAAWRLKSWDRFAIPKPFSKVEVIFDEALAVPASLDEDAFEQWRKRIEDTMLAGVDDL